MNRDDPLWTDPPRKHPHGETRRALDRDIKRAETDGAVFLETEKAALRRQANDIDRLEAMFTAGEMKPWDFNPKTQAHQSYRDALRAFFGAGTADDDPFVAALRALEQQAAHPGPPASLDTAEPGPT